jgi:hypothetical protein
MTDFTTHAYYRRREQQERALASAATSSVVGDIHLELAERYARIASGADAPTPSPRLKLVTA